MTVKSSEKTSGKTVKKEKKKKNKSKNKNSYVYLYLFSVVFLLTLWGLSYLIKSYSPKVDVTIGNNDSYTLNDTEVDVEMKPIDERLRWIQTEDNLPVVQINSNEKQAKEKPQRIKLQKPEQNFQPTPEELPIVKSSNEEFKRIPVKEIILPPKPLITKVYLGNFATMEDAMAVQERVIAISPETAPFIKSVKGYYIVQIGSFYDSKKAGDVAEELKMNGFYPKIKYEN